MANDIDISMLPFTPDELTVILLAVAGRHESKQAEALAVCRRLAALVARRSPAPVPVAPTPWGFLVSFTVGWSIPRSRPLTTPPATEGCFRVDKTLRLPTEKGRSETIPPYRELPPVCAIWTKSGKTLVVSPKKNALLTPHNE